jgi:sialate O-acetylesterase
MKTIKGRLLKIIVLGIILIMNAQVFEASDLRTLVNLSGKWSFNLGDDMKWATADFNDKDWDNLFSGRPWEQQGYVGYDGIAWYRKKITMPKVDEGRTIILHADNIDDNDEIYFNGVLVGSTGKFPPHYIMGYGWERNYVIPAKFINKYGENLIAIRVYDDGGEGGIVGSRIALCVDEDEDFLDLNLAGSWKFSFVDEKNWKAGEFDDSRWDNILVPMSWESQGHFDYDGYGYYRKTFNMPESLLQQKLYLSLGKIDDYDKVFLNGECIGEVSPSRNMSEFRIRRGEYNTKRVYEIPKKLIKGGENTVAVKVYDKGLVGGIYEGPIGIMNEKSLRLYKDKPRTYDFDDNNEYFNLGDELGRFFNDLFQ